MNTLFGFEPEARKLIKFTVYAKPTPQGSMKGFVIPGKNGKKPRAILTTDNKNLKPYRQELSATAQASIGREQPWAGKHVPVTVCLFFYMQRPPSIPKSRKHLVVKPDLSKLVRATEDALTGIIYHDDAQIVSFVTKKEYGTPERVEIEVQIVD